VGGYFSVSGSKCTKNQPLEVLPVSGKSSDNLAGHRWFHRGSGCPVIFGYLLIACGMLCKIAAKRCSA